ncbi:hypothetical protein FOZ63_001508 [Perkinsus olseni]|uniref:Uncharacterized protein n=1 Tax=Perkinsus olseni TaxID=32597 RepID=A0A7J6UNA6_PEROL|nr:hypothetical protein FOZ63_001508 [Perkinsus olseni]
MEVPYSVELGSDELRPADEEAATPLANVCDPTDTAVNTHAHSLEGDPVFPPPATIDGGPRLAVHRLIDDILSSILGTAREDRHGSAPRRTDLHNSLSPKP